VSAQWHLGTVKMPMHPVEMHAQLAALHRVGRMRETDIVDAILYPESNSFVTGKSFTSTAGRALAIDAKTRSVEFGANARRQGQFPNLNDSKNQAPASTARRANCARNRGAAKSTKARTFGTESRPCGVTIWTGNGACSSDLSRICSRPSRTCSAT
jgi:hypothetical protein